MTEYLDFCEQVARACGHLLLEMRGAITPRQKAAKDLVTEADFASQDMARRLIHEAYPGHRFVGEEDGSGARDPGVGSGDPESEYCWIVDPLDGTLNYVRQLPNYCVSVALRRGDRILAGAVYDPVQRECYSAALGRGAMLNGTPIRPSGCGEMAQALIAAGLPADVERDSPDVRRLIEVMHRSQAIRRLGSAALTLCYVAMGRLDAYWATSVKIWDVAAGQLIVREAGGCLTGPAGDPFDLDDPQLVTAGTSRLHSELLAALADASQVPHK